MNKEYICICNGRIFTDLVAALAYSKKLFEDHGLVAGVSEPGPRQRLEIQVVRHLIHTAKDAGYALVSVHDGEERIKCTTEDAAMDVVFSVDESTIRFKHPDQPKSHCAVIVLGNDGWDAIADSSEGPLWDDVMAECGTYSDKLCEENA